MNYLRNGELFTGVGPHMCELPADAPGVFETLRVTGGRPLFWPEHWRRFEAGARANGFTPPVDSEALQRAGVALIDENRIPDGVLRYAAWRERDGSLTWQLEVSGPRPAMQKTELHVTWGPPLDPGGAECAFKHLKRTAWAAATREARAHGFDEVLLTNLRAEVMEAGTANIFIVRNRRLVTPPLSAGPLPGIVRAQVIATAREAGVSVAEERIGRAELEAADEVWLTNSLIGIRPVATLDGRSFRPDRPVLTRTLAAGVRQGER